MHKSIWSLRARRSAMTSLVVSFVLTVALTASAPVSRGLAAQQSRPLRIGVIGSGAMGAPLGLAWAAAGHQVLFSSRNPQELMDLVQQAAPRASAGYSDAAAYFGDVILLAVPPERHSPAR